MHGVVMTGLRKFIVEAHSRTVWDQVKDAAGVDRDRYTRMEDYPDEEFNSIYRVLVESSEASGAMLQRQFGKFLFEEMGDLYGQIYFEDEWNALDLIDNVEETIHKSLKRREDSGFTPPELETRPLGEEGLVVLYESDRQLCEFGKGLMQGVANHYGTTLMIDEPQCMKEGADICRIEVRRMD